MDTAGRIYALSATIALGAMVDRAGWINWPAVGHAARLGLTMLEITVVVLVVMGLVIGIPLAVLVALTEWLLSLLPEQPPAEEPPA